MKSKNNFKFYSTKTLVILTVIILSVLNVESSYSQNYRNAKAYINDFGKNELFVKESLMEYSTSIIDASPQERIEHTMERIYTKLEDINSNLMKNDIGLFGDTDLRTAFLKLNSKTVTLLKNKALKLNDYEIQSALNYPEIFKNFSYKELQISNYYSEILAYENAKREFGLKYNVLIRAYNKKNVFEYNAYENLIFYKLNVLDDKLTDLLKGSDISKVNECINYLVSKGQDGYLKTSLYKNDFTDTSLNDANIEFINFMLKQKQEIIPLYEDYLRATADLQKIKSKFVENNELVSVDEYNLEVKKFNKSKNTFFDTVYENQIKKKDLINRWYITNSDFLKHNIEFENLYERFANTN
ncbi:MAG: hypothetical protein H7239_07970 [Flavobacterium sp.]|nr:hypothetical protein [Flavobacterium sp.]